MNLLTKSRHNYVFTLICLTLAGFVFGSANSFTMSFEEVKLSFLLIGATLVLKPENKSLRVSVLSLSVFLAAMISGIQISQANNPEAKASLWAKTSTQTLTAQKIDSLIKVNEISSEMVKSSTRANKTTEINPIAKAALFTALFSVLSLGAIYLTIVSIFSSPFLFIFFGLLALLSISAALYFFIRIFRSGKVKRRSEQTRHDRRREWKIYVGIFGLALLITIAAFVFANRGTLF